MSWVGGKGGKRFITGVHDRNNSKRMYKCFIVKEILLSSLSIYIYFHVVRAKDSKNDC